MNLLISLYDRTGNQSRPYKEAGWEVIKIDIQCGQDILQWPFRNNPALRGYDKIIVIAAQPCNDYAVSGAKHFAAKDEDGRTRTSQMLVEATRDIIEYTNPWVWQIENPKTRIHKLNPWIGQRPKFVFNPCDFAGWHPEDPEADRYNKETWLFGKFNDPVKKRMEPIYKENPGWKNLGGKSIETKNARSVTPLGFAYAFFDANH